MLTPIFLAALVGEIRSEPKAMFGSTIYDSLAAILLTNNNNFNDNNSNNNN